MTIESFYLHALTPSRVVNVKHAVRIPDSGTLLVGTDNRIYHTNLTGDRAFGHRVGRRISDKILDALMALEVLTPARVNEYRAAVDTADDAYRASSDLLELTDLARRTGMVINEDDPAVRSLRTRAALHDPDALTW